VDVSLAPRVFDKLHQAMQRGLVRSCHDLSEGGLAVAVAEMAFAGGVGADLANLPGETGNEADETLLFSESTSRFILEVAPADEAALRQLLGSLPLAKIGSTCKEPRLRIAGRNGEWLIWTPLADLKKAWQDTLRW
jgi:phosphoribosylformylglycinamidine synthase